MGRTELDRGQRERTESQTSRTVEPTPGKATNTSAEVADPQQDDPRRELDVRPDFSFAVSRTFEVAQIGAIKAKGTVKLDAPNAGVVAKDETSKLQLATRTVGREFDTNKGKTSDFIALALMETSTYLAQPASWLTIDFKSKFSELKLNLDDLKLASIGFRAKATITRDTHPMFAWLPNGYVISGEFELTYDITPKDLVELSEQMKKAVELADQVGDESDKLRDAKILAEKLADDRKRAQGVIESLKGKRLTQLDEINLRNAQSTLAKLEPQMKMAATRITTIQQRLGPLKAALEKVHISWLQSLAKLQPFLKKFEAEIAEQLAKRLLLRWAGKIVSKAHPILAIVTTVVDLLYLCKFLVDLLYFKNLKFVGFGGDYEPSLLDWQNSNDQKKDGAGGDGGGGANTGAREGDSSTPQPPIEAKKKLYDLKGPQARVVSLLLSDGGLEQSLDPAHFETLYRILTTYPIDGSDIGELIAAITVGQGPDQALRSLEVFLQNRDRKPPTPDGAGSGGSSDVDGGGGDSDGGDQRTEEKRETRGETPGRDERRTGGGGGESTPSVASYNAELGESLSSFKGTEPISIVANLKGWITYVDNSNFTGRTVRLVVPGKFTQVKGGWQFTPKSPGIRMVYVRVYETVDGKRVKVRKPVFAINIQPTFFAKKR
jgi:hypothetical protein